MDGDLNLDDLMKWQSEHSVVYALKKDKELRCTLRGSYEVLHKGIVVLETFQPFTAVDKFNSL